MNAWLCNKLKALYHNSKDFIGDDLRTEYLGKIESFINLKALQECVNILSKFQVDVNYLKILLCQPCYHLLILLMAVSHQLNQTWLYQFISTQL